MRYAVFEGYLGKGSNMARRRHGKRSLRKKMKSCARRHKVTSRGFWKCVRGGKKRRR